MKAGLEPAAEPPLRRARQLLPADLPRRRELIAALAVALLLVHLLLAQLTLLLALMFAGLSRATRWRQCWLLVPAAAGVAWILLAGPGPALAGFTAGPASLLRQLGLGSAARTGPPPALFAGIGGWLPRQLPAALPLAAAEAALIGWLGWLHTDEWAVAPPRPGLLAALRTAAATRRIRAGAVLTRDGCALGVVPDSGATATLSWAEISRGVLLTGSDERVVMLAGLQLVHAALRRRKPVFVLDDGHRGAVAAAVAAACAATGTPLLDWADPARRAGGAAPGEASASRLWGRANGVPPRRAGGPVLAPPDPAGLRRVVGERAAVLLRASSPELAAQACAGLAALAADLRRIGVDADALVWVTGAERVPAPALAALLREGAAAGLGVLTATPASGPAAELGQLTGVTVIGRVSDRGLAARLAPLTGTRLRPPAADRLPPAYPPPARPPAYPPPAYPPPAYPPPPHSPAYPPPSADLPLGYPSAGPHQEPVPPPADGLVPSPAVPASQLLALGPAEFILTVSPPRARLVQPLRLVAARLPAPPLPAPPLPADPLPATTLPADPLPATRSADAAAVSGVGR